MAESREVTVLSVLTVMLEAAARLVGTIDVQGPGCTAEWRETLGSRFSTVMTELDALLGLCRDNACDFRSGLTVTCHTDAAVRTKRDISALFRIAVSIDIDGNR